MLRRILLIAALALTSAAGTVQAQVTQADSAAVLLGIATRLRAEGRATLANQLLDLIRERYANTPAAAEAARLRAAVRVVDVDERSGKTELLIWSTTYGLAVGTLVPVAFGADDPEPIGVGMIVGGPLGFLGGRALLKQRTVTEGQARAISFGTLWGAWQGFGWTQVFDIGARTDCSFDVCFEDGPDGEILLRGALLGSAVGLGTGLYLSSKPIPAGTATAVNFGALWGTWYGVVVEVLLSNAHETEDRGLALALLGGDVGLLTTALIAPRLRLSRPRARLISITGVAGGLAGMGLALIADRGDDDTWILMPAAGSAAGLALGTYWTRGYDERQPERDPPEGALLNWRGGKLSGNVPDLQVRALEYRRAGRPVYEAGVQVPLFKATF